MCPEQLTPEQVQFFKEQGYLVVRQAIPAELLASLREGASRLQNQYAVYRKEKDVHYTSSKARSFEEMMDGSAAEDATDRVLWRIDKLDEKLPEVTGLKRLPFVHNAMHALLGDEILQYNESFVTKPPRIGQPVWWHQDPSFKLKKTSDPITTCDVYLDKADQENGCLWVVPGTHRQGVIDAKALIDRHGFDLPGAIPVEMEPGDVAFHDNGVLHGSKANPSDRDRRIVYLAFQTMEQARLGEDFSEEFIQARLTAFEEHHRHLSRPV